MCSGNRKAYEESVLALEKQYSMAQLKELVPAETDPNCKLDFDVAVGEPVGRFCGSRRKQKWTSPSWVRNPGRVSQAMFRTQQRTGWFAK